MSLNKLSVYCMCITIAIATDYCGDLKCQRLPHVACNNPLNSGGFGQMCMDAEIVPMTEGIIQALIDHHNDRRNQQALGLTPNYEPATRMATMQWDPELAAFADLNVRSCIYGHDACMNTGMFSAAGQNIAMSLASMNYVEKRQEIKVIVDLASGWFDEHTNGKYWGWMNFINQLQMPPEHDVKRQIGHFTQLVKDDAYTFGCAATRFITYMTGPKRKAVLLTCNYSVSNIKGEKVYEAGPTASACKTGTNSQYQGLCSPNEVYDAWFYNN